MIKKFVILFVFISSVSHGMLNPVTNINYSCMFPITIGNILSLGSSANPGADSIDKSRSYSSGFLCYCPLLRFGIPFGMTVPAHTLESTTAPFRFPSLGMKGSGGFYRAGGSDAPTTVGAKSAFSHTHLNRFNVLQILDIFQDALCLQSNLSGSFDILYMSEIDPIANSSSTSLYMFPETVLLANPVVAASCAADAVTTLAGATIDTMYWCAGGHSVFPVSNWTPEATSFEDASSITMIKMMYRLNRVSAGSSFPITAGPAAVKTCSIPAISLLVLKSQFRFQTAMPLVGSCERLGTPPIKWNTPKRTNLQGDMVDILWTRQDCCAL